MAITIHGTPSIPLTWRDSPMEFERTPTNRSDDQSRDKHIITAISDASVAAGKFGWSAWARNELDFLVATGSEPLPAHLNTDYGELYALGQAVRLSIHACRRDRPARILVLQSDCIAALGALIPYGAKASKKGDRIVTSRVNMHADVAALGTDIMALCRQHYLDVWLKHVKGHTNRGAGRYSVNRHCDARAGNARLGR